MALFVVVSIAARFVTSVVGIAMCKCGCIRSPDPGVEVLEHWQRLKIHRMPLERYLGEGKMELLKREVESATEIQLKTVPGWFISERWEGASPYPAICLAFADFLLYVHCDKRGKHMT